MRLEVSDRIVSDIDVLGIVKWMVGGAIAITAIVRCGVWGIIWVMVGSLGTQIIKILDH